MKHTLATKQRALLLVMIIIVFSAVKYHCTPQTTEDSRGATYGILPSGDLVVWGVNEYKMADKNSKLSYIPQFLRRVSLRNITCVSGSNYGVMAVDKEGNLWGKSLFPALIPWECSEHKNGWSLLMTDVQAVATGNFQCIAIKNDGSLWIWGFGENGAGFQNSFNPQKTMDNVSSIYAYGNYYFAITTTGSLYIYNISLNPNEFILLHPDVCAVARMRYGYFHILTNDKKLLAYKMTSLDSDYVPAIVAENVIALDEHGYTTARKIRWCWNDSVETALPCIH